MPRAACFRCDWEGETETGACPRCGTELYRPSSEELPARDVAARDAPTRDERVAPSAAPRHAFLSSGTAEPDAAGTSRRSRPFAAFVALAVLLTAGVWWFLRTHEVPEGVDAASPPPSGRLVYATGDAATQRLWTWDPRSETVAEGPALDDEVVQLVSAQGALAGWLGVTTRDTEGLLEASILRTQTAEARPEHLYTADLVAWGPNGASVVVAGLGNTTNGCYANLKVYREQLDRDLRERTYHSTLFCGGIPTLGQTLATTYFTWERPGGTGVYFLGNGEPHRVLRGWSMLAVSPTSDLLVQPAPPPAAPAGGAALFWRGAPAPDPYHGSGGGRVQVSRILTWTIDADGALVEATVDGREGLYLLDTTPGGDRVPRYVGIDSRPVFATAAFDGSIYVTMQGHLLSWRDEHLMEVPLPQGAPHPTGPIAWLPG